jgi:hypothetical protein
METGFNHPRGLKSSIYHRLLSIIRANYNTYPPKLQVTFDSIFGYVYNTLNGGQGDSYSGPILHKLVNSKDKKKARCREPFTEVNKAGYKLQRLPPFKPAFMTSFAV